jgi:hypothetical protein
MAWEYVMLDLPGYDASESDAHELHALGAEGWELVAVTVQGYRRTLYLKRPKEDEVGSLGAALLRVMREADGAP